MPRHFLTARWSNLLLLTYAVPAERLLPHLPPGCSLDRLPGDPDTTAYVSLVAFNFLDTRVLGLPWPGYRNFPEINLRFYLRHGNDRGVAFIREFVPQRLTALMARRIYNEPYRAAPMTSRTTITANDLHIRHTLRWGGATAFPRGLRPEPPLSTPARIPRPLLQGTPLGLRHHPSG